MPSPSIHDQPAQTHTNTHTYLLHVQPGRIVQVKGLVRLGPAPLHLDPGHRVQTQGPVAVMDGLLGILTTKMALSTITAGTMEREGG